MNPASRNVLAAVVTAAVALGVTAPVAAAAPKDRSGPVVQAGKPDKVAEKAEKAAEKVAEKADKLAEQVEKLAEKAAKATEKPAKAKTSGKTSVAAKDAPKVKGKDKATSKKAAKLKGKADRRLAQLQRRLTKDAVKKERFLKRLVASKKVTRLPAAQQASVISSNISADLSELADLKAAIAAGDDLGAVAADLRSLRPEVYNVILNQLRLAEKLRVELGAVDEPVADQPVAEEPVAEEPVAEEPVATVTAEDGSTDGSQETDEDLADDDVADEPAEDADDTEDAETPVVDEGSLDEVVAKLLTFNARTPRAELRATQRSLSQIKESLEADDADEADEAGDADEAEDADEADEADDAVDDDTPLAGTPVISS
ncbi:MAG: hypothetical protein ACOYX5_17325 [Actinomycetota bacterium]